MYYNTFIIYFIKAVFYLLKFYREFFNKIARKKKCRKYAKYENEFLRNY